MIAYRTADVDKALFNLRQFFHPAFIIPNILSSIVLWIVTIVVAVSCAALIFKGELLEYAEFGIAIAIVSAIIINLMVAIFGSDYATVGSPQSAPVLIQASLVGGFIMEAPPTMSDEEIFLTAASIIIVSAFLMGLFMLLLSAGRAGSLIRYVPYPVMGGFLAGSGFLLLQDSFAIMTDMQLFRYPIDALLEGPVIARWLPGLAYAIGLLALLRRTGNFALLPVGIVAGVALFYLALSLSDVDTSTAAANGWLMADLDSGIGQNAFAYVGLLNALSQVDIVFVVAQAGTLATLTVIALLNALVNLSGQEMIVNREINLNRELATSACANMLSSLFGGGIISLPCLACTALVHQARAHGRLVCVSVSALLLITLTQGADALTLFPRAIIGGLLAYIGLNFMVTWLYDTWGKMSRQDYLVILVMVFIIAYRGFIFGMISGVLLSIVLIAVEYARMGAVKQDFLGDEYQSTTASQAKSGVISRLDQQVWILRLQGMLFFGTSHQFYRRIKSRLDTLDENQNVLKYIVLDFQLVKSIDISAVMDFSKVRVLADRYGIHILLSNLPAHVRRVLVDSNFAVKDRTDGMPDSFYDLDHAMQWCEHKLLEHSEIAKHRDRSTNALLNQYLDSHEFRFEMIEPFLERHEFRKDEIIAHQSDQSDSLFFIEQGRINIELHETDRIVHLHSMGAGTVVGEMGFYLSQPRTASIVSAQPSVLYSLSRESLALMEREEPTVAIAFHSFTSAILSERLTATNRMIQALTA